MNNNFSLARGTVVTGKWNGRSYLIERALGEGANGKVYLVRSGRKLFAMKMGFDALDHQSEVNALRTLDQHIRRDDPFLLDVDDYTSGDDDIPFYVMQYVDGNRLHEFLRKRKRDWVYPVGRSLLLRLVQLHRHGWIFGDLKMENVMVKPYGEVELVDYGGVTAKGRSVRQFTEVYDRGYWGSGSRTADESYDLFSFAVLFLQVMYPDQQVKDPASLSPQNRSPLLLLEPLRQDAISAPLVPVFRNMLEGRYASSYEALQAWRAASRTGKSTIPVASISRAQATSSIIGGWFVCSFVFFMMAVFWLLT